MHPELSFEEVETTAFLLEELGKIPGLELHTPTRTGVVAVLKGAYPGRTIAIRGDIDALPIQEETELPFASRVPGVMHACGHDGHTSMLLCAARLLAAQREELHGEVRFFFQHAEELPPGGAIEMVRAGVMEGGGGAVWPALELQFSHRDLRCPAGAPDQRYGSLRYHHTGQRRAFCLSGNLRGSGSHRCSGDTGFANGGGPAYPGGRAGGGFRMHGRRGERL